MKALIAMSIAFVVAQPSLVEAKQSKKSKHVTKPATMSQNRAIGSGPARMIEVRPGYWISSYGCAQDAGYGRFTPCDLTDGNH